MFINATQIIPKLWEVKGDKGKLITLENRYPSVLTCLDSHSFRIIIKKKKMQSLSFTYQSEREQNQKSTKRYKFFEEMGLLNFRLHVRFQQ